MMDTIGQSAGQIWEYLSGSKNCEATLTKMKKDLDLKGNFAELGLGWLAREGKVDISKSGATTKVKLL